MTLAEFAADVTARQAANPRTGRTVLGDLVQPCDDGADFLESTNYYSWYYHIGAVLQPSRLIEFGVRFGYSLKAMIDGSGNRVSSVWVTGVDDERDGAETLDVFEDHFRSALFPVGVLELYRADTQKILKVGRDGWNDLAHVDAWHTEEGCYHECELAYAAVRPGGFVLVDDAAPGEVRRGVDRFCAERWLNSVYFPTLRGMVVFRVPE